MLPKNFDPRHKVSLITAPEYQRHDTGGGAHPETPERLAAILARLQTGSLQNSVEIVSPRPAKRLEILAFHQESWLFRFEEAALSGHCYICHNDNQISFESYDVALLSAGAGLTAIDLVEQDGAQIVFCANRPPGHHAEPNLPYGFCFFNNCAIAARYWQQAHGRQRICVFDFDAHHGNGIQTAFENDRDTLYISIHEDPRFSFPGTGWPEEQGIGEGKGTIGNIPLPLGAGDKQFLAVLDGPVHEHFVQFKPEAIIIAAGFDGHTLDDMSSLNYSTDLYGQIGQRIALWSKELCEGRVISILEGGYHLLSLGESVESYLNGFITSYDLL